MNGRKNDNEKPRWDLLPVNAVSNVVDVLTYGASKYADENWRDVPNSKRRYYAAAMRHLAAWKVGEKEDQETDLPHLAHAACCLLFLLSAEVGHDPKLDDKAFAKRYPTWIDALRERDLRAPFVDMGFRESPLEDDDLWPGEGD